VHAARKQDRRLQAALLAAAVAHTPEAEEVLRGARTRLARKPSALSRELLRNFPKGKGRRSRRRRKKATAGAGPAGRAGAARMRAGPDEQVLDEALASATTDGAVAGTPLDGDASTNGDEQVSAASDGDRPAQDRPAAKPRARRQRRRNADPEGNARRAAATAETTATTQEGPASQAEANTDDEQPAAAKPRSRRSARAAEAADDAQPAEQPKPRRTRKKPTAKDDTDASEDSPAAAA
jgi:hypothetical protein